jgi:hypothetical protein
MKLSELISHLSSISELNFQFEYGNIVPSHFHITEIGIIRKDFIDCAGKIRHEEIVNFQLWFSNDYHHRLSPKKFLEIITLSEQKLGIQDLEIEVEYQDKTIGKYNLDFVGDKFILQSKYTACLAEDQCVMTQTKPRIKISDLTANSINCKPGSNCC